MENCFKLFLIGNSKNIFWVNSKMDLNDDDDQIAWGCLSRKVKGLSWKHNFLSQEVPLHTWEWAC